MLFVYTEMSHFLSFSSKGNPFAIDHPPEVNTILHRLIGLEFRSCAEKVRVSR